MIYMDLYQMSICSELCFYKKLYLKLYFKFCLFYKLTIWSL